MVRKLKCECCERYGTRITTQKKFIEIKIFFDEQCKKGIFLEELDKKPYYVWIGKGRKREYFATKWYRCCVCRCLWEFEYPDFPAFGFVRKYVDGVYNGTEVVENKNGD
jgi:hypothetical protein